MPITYYWVLTGHWLASNAYGVSDVVDSGDTNQKKIWYGFQAAKGDHGAEAYLQGSNDNSTWTTIDGGGQRGTDGAVLKYVGTKTVTYRYFRFTGGLYATKDYSDGIAGGSLVIYGH